MRNRNVLIVGQPGAGKTQLTLRLIDPVARVVIFDPVSDYGPGPSGIVVWDGESALRELAERWDEPFRIVVRAEDDAEYAAVASLIERIQREPGAPPVAVVLEEAAVYSGSTFQIAEPIRRLYTLGRRWRINCIAVTQVDTDVHRVFRHATHIWVALRSQKLSSDLLRTFYLADIQSLEPLTPGVRATPGRHYMTSPDGTDLFREFWDVTDW